MLPHKKLALHRSFSVFVILCILISIFQQRSMPLVLMVLTFPQQPIEA